MSKKDLGIILSADNKFGIDWGVELKGFKRLDSMVGLMVADGAGCAVMDLQTGRPIDFAVDEQLESIVFEAFHEDGRPKDDKDAVKRAVKKLVNLRIKFVVAGNEDLAKQIRALVTGK